MIAVDTNILAYAHRQDSPWHTAAAARVRELAEGANPWMIPYPCLHEFLAVVTHPRIYAPPSTIDQAISQVDAWMESPSLSIEPESPRHWSFLKELMSKGRLTGPAVHDARVAAICLSHGVGVLWTADRDFSRLPGLRVENPLVA